MWIFNQSKLSFITARWAKLRVFFVVVIAVVFLPFARATDSYLEPEAAFQFSARMVDARTVEITYVIADGYYMYREHFQFKADKAKLGMPAFPPAKVKFDDTFQKNVETYRNKVTIRLPIETVDQFTLAVTGQGCADQGLCYAPMTSQVKLSSGSVGTLPLTIDVVQKEESNNKSIVSSVNSEMGHIETSLRSGKLLVIVPLFLLLGLGLSLTPCVLPMVPILSFIIVGEGVQARRVHSFLLSVSYVFGMALVYTAFGIAAGLIGEGLSAALQNRWILGGFAVLMVLLSLSMFGVYQLQIPSVIQLQLAKLSEQQSAGKLFGVFMMGAISALIVGPCVAAPLAGTLIYISQTHNVVVGGSALFSMAFGMGVPLLLMGASAGVLLPRAGAWMETIKRFFGVLMLLLAIWIISPVVPVVVSMMGWGVIGIGYGMYLFVVREGRWAVRGAGLLFSVFGMIQLVGVVTGGRDALTPLAYLMGNPAKKIEFMRVRSSTELDAVLMQAKGKTVLLDFYADWCISCKELERLTFPDSRVQTQFANMVLLQADVTQNNVNDKALLKRFHLFGPPSIIFFDKQGREIQGGRVIGYQDAEKFLQSLVFVAAF